MELDTSHRDDVESGQARQDRSPPSVGTGQPAGTGQPVGTDNDTHDHHGVFTSLVTGDTDIVGLVAYSIYKQNKYDWLMAFSRHRGRMPNAEETVSYLHGESTARRLATYRHLAEATLDGRGPQVPGSSRAGLAAGTAPTRRPVPAEPAVTSRPGRPLLIAIICAVAVVVGLVWYFHGGPMPR